MDQPLTPGKIKRLINFAEDRCTPHFQRLPLEDRNRILRLAPEHAYVIGNTQYQDCLRTSAADISSGLLDLERVEGFGDSADGSVSMSKSTAFNPGEMTGRSTETDDVEVRRPLYGRHSMAIENIERKMNKQTSDVVDTMRYSICTDATFHSRRDLTADEASFANKGGALQYHTITRFTDANNTCDKTDGTPGNMSVGAYFQNRCEDFHRILNNVDSPDRSMAPSITEVSSCLQSTPVQSLKSYSVDPMLDKIPVRQPRVAEIQHSNKNNLNVAKLQEKQRSNLDNEIVNLCDSRLKGDNLSKTLCTMNAPRPCRILNTTSKANDLLKKTLQSSMKVVASDESCALDAENSISISKIADYLGGKHSNISVTELLNKHKTKANKKQPLTELQMNVQPPTRQNEIDDVVHLKDTKKTETSSSTNTVDTVVSLDKLIINNMKQIPEVMVTRDTLAKDMFESGDLNKHGTRSKSPSTKSQSTLSTVKETCLSFKSGDSPLQSSRENWVEITTMSSEGFVGVSCPITISVTTLSESWLTASFRFDDLPNNSADLAIELPRFPILLSPGNTEKIVLHITSSVEMNTTLPFTISLKDVSIDAEIEQKGDLQIKFYMPSIKAMSNDGVNKITFPETFENSSLVKSFVLFSDFAVDLQLAISIVEGDSMFSIKSIQEIKKGDINKVLMERHGSVDDQQGRTKNKAMNKQLCKLSNGNAIKVSLRFNAPELGDLKDSRRLTPFTGTVHVNLIGVNTLLRKVDLVGFVGYTHLDFIMTNNKLQIGKIPTTLTLSNVGNMAGTWVMRHICKAPNEDFFFKIAPSNFEIQPGGSVDISMVYIGPDDVVTESKISFEEVKSGKRTSLDIVSGTEKPKIFPIKTNRSTLSWVRSGRKELSLKNSTDKKVQIRCSIIGDGFSLDMPGIDSTRGGAYCLNFGPLERRSLPIIFTPSTSLPHSATLHVVIDKNSEFTRKVRLYGCAASDCVRWFSQVTYGDTALVRAASRAPIKLELFNKSTAPAFICAQVHFNLQFRSLESTASVVGARRVIGGRAKHALVVNVEWARVEARVRAREAPATALATVTVLTGHEYTRRRILKVLKDRSDGELDTSPLPAHLAVLADVFVGEDPEFDLKIADFNETEASLAELLSGLQELTAQIDLPQDFTEDNTIIISDDTVLEHHTLYE
ncbi:hypothetical protein K1T71_009705 [Dendrolimus kikuchii]|uniref:Uncharacterized protein n=1 Tax=Dendrolimus kikuchii TaxID=765133 RepID=A0ACC1CTM9_9NEOP|nr:hypothetical protein K1T71_009705 [Dendrolimus kikuchii]